MKKYSLLILLFLCTFLNAIDKTTFRPYRLVNADSINITKVESNFITNLYGNVNFFYGNTEFLTDFAQIIEEDKIVILNGNVRVSEDSLSLKSHKATYYRKEEKIIINGNCFLQETHSDSTKRTFEAEKITVLRNQKNVIAEKNVKSFDERENIHHNSNYLFYDFQNGYGYIINEPKVWISNKDSLSISAQKMEFFQDYQKVVATFEVKTRNQNFVINSNFLIYLSKEQKAIFMGEPKFFSDLADANSNEITLFFDKNNLYKAVLIDSCYVNFSGEDKIKTNMIEANKIVLLFKDKKLTNCHASGNVNSFIIQEKNAKEDFKNKVISEDLEIRLDENNKIIDLKVFNNVKGHYYFKN